MTGGNERGTELNERVAINDNFIVPSMTSHSAGGAIRDDAISHSDAADAQVTDEIIHGADSVSLKSVEISLDTPPRSPMKSPVHDHAYSSEDVMLSPAHTESSFSVIQDHPLLAKQLDKRSSPSEAPPAATTGDAHTTTAGAPSVSSARTSMAPSLTSTLASEAESTTSITSSVSVAKKVRPESVIIDPGSARLILGLAVVDFNHLVSPLFNASV